MTHRIVLDTNIIISAIVFGGQPKNILQLVLRKNIISITSPYLITELKEVLIKKFDFSEGKIDLLEANIKESFLVINPKINIEVLEDRPDNRVLEAAIEGKCDYIISGDKKLLELASFKGVKIVTANQFLETANTRKF